MAIVVYRHSTDIHLYLAINDGFEYFLLTSQAIVNLQHCLQRQVKRQGESLKDALVKRNY
jgi:hypothetical protein